MKNNTINFDDFEDYDNSEYARLDGLPKRNGEEKKRLNELKRLRKKLRQDFPYTEGLFRKLQEMDEETLGEAGDYLVDLYAKKDRCRELGKKFLSKEPREYLTLEQIQVKIGEILALYPDPDPKKMTKEDRKELARLKRNGQRKEADEGASEKKNKAHKASENGVEPDDNETDPDLDEDDDEDDEGEDDE